VLENRMLTEDDLLFPSYRKAGRPMTSIKNSIRFACRRAGIDRITIRDLRRTFGTRLHENGFDDKTVADLLGHSDLRSVHRYKRGTEIRKTAILSLDSTKILPPTKLGALQDASEPPNLLVGTSRVELLTPTVSRDGTTLLNLTNIKNLRVGTDCENDADSADSTPGLYQNPTRE